MSLLTQFHIAGDNTLQSRIIAAAVNADIPEADFWVPQRMWKFSRFPGWVEAYKRADGGPGDDMPDPGADETAITDQMIVDAVQTMFDEQTAAHAAGGTA